MYSLMQLVINECLKITKKKSFIVTLIVILVGAITGAWFMSGVIGRDFMSSGAFGSSMIGISGAGIVYLVFCIVTSSTIVSQEHQAGTIKLLLIRGHQRHMILASKLLALIVYMVVIMVYFVVVSYIVGFLFFHNTDGMLIEQALKNMGTTFLYTFSYTVIAFMCSTLLKSSGGTIGLVLSISIFEGIIVTLLGGYDFAKYILFFHTNFGQYLDGGVGMLEGITPLFSTILYSLYMILFLAITFVVFRKRDVT